MWRHTLTRIAAGLLALWLVMLAGLWHARRGVNLRTSGLPWWRGRPRPSSAVACASMSGRMWTDGCRTSRYAHPPTPPGCSPTCSPRSDP